MTVTPLGFLLPPRPGQPRQAMPLAQQPDPMAFLMANTPQPARGLVPTDDDGEEYPFGEEVAPAAPTPTQQAAPPPDVAGGMPVNQPMPATSPVNQPPVNNTPPSSQWASWLQNEDNQNYLYGLGVQLMVGSSGNFLSQLGTAMAVGANTAAGAARQREAGRDTRGAGRGRGRRVAGGRLAAAPAPAPDPQLAAVEQFINSNPTPEAWAEANQPGGLIHAVFGGAQDQARSQELLQLVQAQTQRPATPQGPRVGGISEGLQTARRGRLTPEQAQELIALGSSQDQADRAAFQALAGYHFGGGYEYFVDANGVSRRRTPLASRPSRPSETAFSQAAAGGADAARVTINDVRDFLATSVTSRDPTGITGMIQRGVQQQTDAGDWAAAMGSLEEGVMSYVHQRSGAQVAVREFERYLQIHMPRLGDSEARIQYKLAKLELGIMMIARRRGEPVSYDDLLAMHNRARTALGWRPTTPEQFLQLVPSLEHQAGVRPGANVEPPRELPARTPAPTQAPRFTPPPPTAGPESLQAPPPPPTPGTIMQGYRFKGGDPSKPENWEPVR